MNPKFLILGLVIATVFTVSLTENLQLADGFLSKSTAGWTYELQVGESQVLIWTIINTEDVGIDIEFRGENKGSELFIYEKLISFEAGETKNVEFIVIVPDDHPDNVEYHVDLFAKELAQKSDTGAASVLLSYQMVAHPVVKIGDDPYFTPVPKKVVVEEDLEPVVQEEISDEDFKATAPVETLEEKLERIMAANEANEESTPEITVTETPEVKDSSYIEEQAMDPEPVTTEEGGGCLIATATFGSEMAPQVQFLREIRDNTLLSTASGASFMTGFNQLYYSFSPIIADYERENPLFKEAVKLALAPMLSSLSIMTLADEGSESQVLGLGISVIVLNLAIYIGSPVYLISRLRK